MIAILAFGAASSIPAQQQSKVVFKGAATNSNGVRFSDWEMRLFKKSPLKMTRSIGVPEAHTYYFKARKGQYVFAKLASKNPTVNFEIFDANGKKLGDSTTEDWSWQGDLETDGEYKIVVSADRKGSYLLTVKLD